MAKKRANPDARVPFMARRTDFGGSDRSVAIGADSVAAMPWPRPERRNPAISPILTSDRHASLPATLDIRAQKKSRIVSDLRMKAHAERAPCTMLSRYAEPSQI